MVTVVLSKVIYTASYFVVVKFQLAKKSVMYYIAYVAELTKMATECDDKDRVVFEISSQADA